MKVFVSFVAVAVVVIVIFVVVVVVLEYIAACQAQLDCTFRRAFYS